MVVKISPQIIDRIEDELAWAELQHPNFPIDPLRRAALMCEEAGEALKEALNLTRGDPTRREPLRHEVVQTAAMAIKLLQAMDEEP